MVSETATLPTWVLGRDGRREPFDADRIVRGLYEAGERVGKRDPFLARELAGAVLHFLSLEGRATASAEWIAEQVAKVVRQVGHADVAQAYTERRARPVTEVAVRLTATDSPRQAAARALRAYSEAFVYSPDLMATVRDGILQFDGMDTPGQLIAAVVEWKSADPVDQAGRLNEARRRAGQVLVVDSPEWLGAPAAPERLALLPDLTERFIVVNLNTAEPPAWAAGVGNGPLFDSGVAESAAGAFADGLRPVPRLLWRWHLRPADFAGGLEKLRAVVRRVLDRMDVEFVFDRPRHPIALADGVNRRAPTLLAGVTLRLDLLARSPAVAGRLDRLLGRLPSLAQMAASGGVQRRASLRRVPELANGFLLAQSGMLVTVIGIDRLGGLDEAQRGEVMATLNQYLASSCRLAHLDVTVQWLGRTTVWHTLAPGTTAGEVVELLRSASRQPAVTCVRFTQLRDVQGELPG